MFSKGVSNSEDPAILLRHVSKVVVIFLKVILF